MDAAQPLVSIVTPVYNGEKYLPQCIESVLNQTYENWEYVIANNQSTDGTLDIAKSYASNDSRVRVTTNDTFLPLIQNWNNALRQISGQSKYCKVVHADDLLMPDCIDQMVAVAEGKPSIGLVGAYRIEEDHVTLDELPYPTTWLSGHEICRRQLLGRSDMFGSPTSILIRADLVRARERFYNEQNLHADTEVCFDLLQETDFGFVHQVLTYTRRHNEAVTSFARALRTHKASQFYLMKKYGPRLLTNEEYRECYKILRKHYYRALALTFVKGSTISEIRSRRREFWKYHKKVLAEIDEQISLARLLGSTLAIFYNKSLDILTIK